MYYNAPEMWVARSARPVPSMLYVGRLQTAHGSLTNQ